MSAFYRPSGEPLINRKNIAQNLGSPYLFHFTKFKESAQSRIGITNEKIFSAEYGDVDMNISEAVSIGRIIEEYSFQTYRNVLKNEKFKTILNGSLI